MTYPINPWASTDHDPSSNTEAVTDSSQSHSTTRTLALARADIHTAVGAHDDPHRRVQYARSALSYANTVLLAADATDEQRRYAGFYREDALAMIAGA
ncbi:hypothetical protein [Mycobacterium sp. 29Ha]|uniref:hypothetical protein n=1 Tax=Mycobacterium sp. 29Ha TaxID=2939268 RepID=UPI00293953AB|nr:hypothetical protein [Mycobacterium sp. 29Ha]MDV3133349.1 hypothetical protein [Mycobacterium sp. 29Ha]